MTTSEQRNVAVQVSDEQPQQQFHQLNLQEIGLQPDDFQEVLAARKELSDLSHHSVAEYGKNIATKTSSYTDELLGLVQNKDLDVTGQKLNQVVQVAPQLNTNTILLPNKSTG